MRVVSLVANATTTGTKTAVNIVGSLREKFTIQLWGTGTFDVDIEGSFDGTNWESLAIDKTAGEIFQVNAIPYLRVNCVTMTGADISVTAGV